MASTERLETRRKRSLKAKLAITATKAKELSTERRDSGDIRQRLLALPAWLSSPLDSKAPDESTPKYRSPSLSFYRLTSPISKIQSTAAPHSAPPPSRPILSASEQRKRPRSLSMVASPDAEQERQESSEPPSPFFQLQAPVPLAPCLHYCHASAFHSQYSHYCKSLNSVSAHLNHSVLRPAKSASVSLSCLASHRRQSTSVEKGVSPLLESSIHCITPPPPPSPPLITSPRSALNRTPSPARFTSSPFRVASPRIGSASPSASSSSSATSSSSQGLNELPLQFRRGSQTRPSLQLNNVTSVFASSLEEESNEEADVSNSRINQTNKHPSVASSSPFSSY